MQAHSRVEIEALQQTCAPLEVMGGQMAACSLEEEDAWGAHRGEMGEQ